MQQVANVSHMLPAAALAHAGHNYTIAARFSAVGSAPLLVPQVLSPPIQQRSGRCAEAVTPTGGSACAVHCRGASSTPAVPTRVACTRLPQQQSVAGTHVGRQYLGHLPKSDPVQQLSHLQAEPAPQPAVSVGDLGPLTDDSEEDCCAICLGTGEEVDIVQELHCGHTYCRSCLTRYVTAQSQQHQPVKCPQCRQQLLPEEVAACMAGGSLDGLLRAASNRFSYGPGIAADIDLEAEQDFFLVAHEADMRRCPHCSAAIVRDGSWNHMTCFCGHHFDWNEAERVAAFGAGPSSAGPPSAGPFSARPFSSGPPIVGPSNQSSIHPQRHRLRTQRVDNTPMGRAGRVFSTLNSAYTCLASIPMLVSAGLTLAVAGSAVLVTYAGGRVILRAARSNSRE